MNPLELALQQQKELGLYRSLLTLQKAPAKYVIRDGVVCLNCASNNYLDLAGHPSIKAKATEALENDGTGSGGSRSLGGNLLIHEQLERALTKYRPLGKSLLMNSGFQANLTVVQALGEVLGGVFADKHSHASVVEGLKLLRKPFYRFRHNDLNHLEGLLRQHQPEQGGLVVTESLFSMDGDFSPLAELAELQRRYGFWLLIDEAHSTGCIPSQHLPAYQGLTDRLVFMGTFGKALGSFGAYVSGPSEAIDLIINFGHGFLFSTSLPPVVVGANLGALELVTREDESWRQEHLVKISNYARAKMQTLGINMGSSQSHIIPVILGSMETAMNVSFELYNEGIHAPAIRPPTVPVGTSRLRFNLTSAFTEEDVDRFIDSLQKALKCFSS